MIILLICISGKKEKILEEITSANTKNKRLCSEIFSHSPFGKGHADWKEASTYSPLSPPFGLPEGGRAGILPSDGTISQHNFRGHCKTSVQWWLCYFGRLPSVMRFLKCTFHESVSENTVLTTSIVWSVMLDDQCQTWKGQGQRLCDH